jgi:hypothetical protein
MLGIILITLIFIGSLVGFSKMGDIEEVKKNWSKYRCRPDVMLMADYYGHNSSDNMEFCLKSGFDSRSSGAVLPFYSYMKGFVDVLMNMLSSLNSIRLTFATIVGSVTNVFSEFSSRIKSLFFSIQVTSIRMKMLMGRIFATLYSIIFMGMAGIKATTNFGNTFLFKFLDTFCFDPDTLVLMKTGIVRIKDIQIGDHFITGERVTATFAFKADGQSMVDLGGIIVSTNHYVSYQGKWIKADAHPDAFPVADWAGGAEKPLICLNTDKHSFPIGGYVFSDYDETEKGDEAAMKMAMDMLNGPRDMLNGPRDMLNGPRDMLNGPRDMLNGPNPDISNSTPPKQKSSSMACGKETLLQKKGLTPVPAEKINLTTSLTQGEVIGIVKKECYEFCTYKGERFAPGTALWSDSTNRWIRVGDIVPIQTLTKPETFYSFVVSPSACISTAEGTLFRDYVEVHTPELEIPYALSLNPLSI